ncbi:hypothetical protein Hanom_Chr12g01134161 [Helianthus anomalus]
MLKIYKITNPKVVFSYYKKNKILFQLIKSQHYPINLILDGSKSFSIFGLLICV